MQFNESDLEEITKIASTGYPPRHVAFMMGVSPTAFEALIKVEEHPASIAYFKGLFSMEQAIRENMMQLARSGSSPAQTSALKIFDDTKRELSGKDFPGFEQD